MSNLTVAIVLWTVYLILNCIGKAYEQRIVQLKWLSWCWSAVTLSLFVAGIVMTVRAENDRHDQGVHGLGPAGVLAILANVVPPILLGGYTLTRNFYSNRV